MNSRLLAWWTSIFGILFLFAAAGISFWSLSLSDPSSQSQATLLAALSAVGGGTLSCLGMACWRIVALEERIRELERSSPSSPDRPGS